MERIINKLTIQETNKVNIKILACQIEKKWNTKKINTADIVIQVKIENEEPRNYVLHDFDEIEISQSTDKTDND